MQSKKGHRRTNRPPAARPGRGGPDAHIRRSKDLVRLDRALNLRPGSLARSRTRHLAPTRHQLPVVKIENHARVVDLLAVLIDLQRIAATLNAGVLEGDEP